MAKSMSFEAARLAVGQNEDLLEEILLRVPAKSLIRFRRVSKNLLALISDAKFEAKHARKNFTISVSGLYITTSSFNRIKQPASLSHTACPPKVNLFDGTSHPIIDSCNGLMLLRPFFYMTYIVCNPTTQNYKILPKHVNENKNADVFEECVCLTFDPSKSTHYKVVEIFYGHNRYEFEIYNSESGCWRTVCIAAPHNAGCFKFRGWGYWNGAIHWTCCMKKFHHMFDTDEETLTITEICTEPMIQSENGLPALYLGECGGRFLLVRHSSAGYEILEMERGKLTWTLKYDFSYDVVQALCVIFIFESLEEGGKSKDEVALVVSSGSGIYLYTLMNENLELLQNRAALDRFGGSIHAFPFIETLSPV